MLFIKLTNGWWELDIVTLKVYNYDGGYHILNKSDIDLSKTIECDTWHDLYKITGWCPLEVNIRWNDVWISPQGKFYNGEAHENRAEEILEILYDEKDVTWAGDRLEELGWVRATTSLMWEVRFDEWHERTVTQKQFDSLFDWCVQHNKAFPTTIDIK